MLARLGSGRVVGWAVAALSILALVAQSQPAHAQVLQTQAEIKAVTGRAEVLRRGQAQWAPATVGAKLAEGDEVRTSSGASAELELPDATNILVSENSRLRVTKLAVDSQSQTRLALFHLSVGKVRAAIARPAIQLVRARQSNFAISTPGGVAATRGTTYVTAYDPATATSLVAVLDGNVIFADFFTNTFVSIPLNTYITQTGSQPPTGIVPISSLAPAIQSSLTGTANPVMVNSPALQVPPSQPLTSLVVGTIACAYRQAGQDPAAFTGLALLAPEFAGTIQSGLACAAGGGAGVLPGGGATGGGTPSSVGRDQQVCGTKPCS